MAKGSTPTILRLASTVNARYYPVAGVSDAYCLNGKYPGKRELRAVNTTLEIESQGFLLSVFGSPEDEGRTPQWRVSLNKLAERIRSEHGDIDRDVNDLAEMAVEVTGSVRLSEDSAREPYFAGLIMCDGEVAAVSIGTGYAFIYRREALYSLTGGIESFEAVDLYGNDVEGIDDFIAGEAGTIRYSNIARLEEGDVLILCSGELYDVLGQREMIRLLGESEDQMDAAGLLLTAATSQMPGTPMQVAVANVIAIKASEAPQRFSLGRFATQAMEPIVESDLPKEEKIDLDRTQRYQRRDMLDRLHGDHELTKEASFPLEEETDGSTLTEGHVSDADKDEMSFERDEAVNPFILPPVPESFEHQDLKAA